MRSLWTAASGMKSQQLNVDTIANNLANVNTSGFKKERLEFKSLLYETMTKANTNQDGSGKPVNLQVGHGVRPVATVKSYTQGNMEMTSGNNDFAINGNGFFVINGSNGEQVYTRDGSFKTAVVDGGLMLVTSTGQQVLSTEDEPIIIPENVDPKKISVQKDGSFAVTHPNGFLEDLGIKFKLVQFRNPQGLQAVGTNLLKETTASGEPVTEFDNDDIKKSSVMQGFIESSNVQIVEEMVKMIVAQRAYEMNSKAIQTSDDMLQQANQLKK